MQARKEDRSLSETTGLVIWENKVQGVNHPFISRIKAMNSKVSQGMREAFP